MPIFQLKVSVLLTFSINEEFNKIIIIRASSKNHPRLLANGVGSASLSDSDDNENNGARTREMSSILGGGGGRNGGAWKLSSQNNGPRFQRELVRCVIRN